MVTTIRVFLNSSVGKESACNAEDPSSVPGLGRSPGEGIGSLLQFSWGSLVAQSCPTLCDPMDYTVHGILQARILKWVAFPCSRYLPTPGIEPRSPAWQADSLLAEPPGKPMNTGVGSHSLLQGIFPTQELNWGLSHCGQILYQLSNQGS